MEVLVKLLETDKHHVAEAIVEESKKMDANTNSRYNEAIVLASHKRGAIKEFFLGSVANYVLHHSNVAVIVQKIKFERMKSAVIKSSMCVYMKSLMCVYI